MGERPFTLLELHFHNHGGVQVGPKSRTTGGRMGLADRLRRRTGLPDRFRRQAPSGEDRGRRTALPIPLAVGGVALLALVAVTWQAIRDR